MTQREIKRAIYLSGIRSTGYTVHHDMPGEAIVCEVASVNLGNTIVRALRGRQAPSKVWAWSDSVRRQNARGKR